MDEPRWTIRLSLNGPLGERFDVSAPVDHAVAVEQFVPLRPLSDYFPGEISFDLAVKVLQRREIRKDLLRETCVKLGTMLAEHLEDKEGWHGAHRKEALCLGKTSHRSLRPGPSHRRGAEGGIDERTSNRFRAEPRLRSLGGRSRRHRITSTG